MNATVLEFPDTRARVAAEVRQKLLQREDPEWDYIKLVDSQLYDEYRQNIERQVKVLTNLRMHRIKADRKYQKRLDDLAANPDEVANEDSFRECVNFFNRLHPKVKRTALDLLQEQFGDEK